MNMTEIAQYYRRGVEAMEQQNWAMAVDMFRACARRDPDNSMLHQILFTCEKKKAEGITEHERLVRHMNRRGRNGTWHRTD